jgi:hypothetical protein
MGLTGSQPGERGKRGFRFGRAVAGPAPPYALAAWIADQTLSGVAGMSTPAMP